MGSRLVLTVTRGLWAGWGRPPTGTSAAIFDVTPSSVVLQFSYPRLWGEPYVPGGFVTGPDHAIWIADWGLTNAIERWAPGGQLTSYPLPDGGTSIAIVAGPENALWFTSTSGKIGRITTSGEITEFLINDGNTFAFSWGFAGPYGITAGADGALWFAEQAVGRIGRLTTTGQLREVAIPNPAAPASAGALTPAPRHIVTAPDGSMWFTDPGDGSIGQINPTSGAVTEYPVPASGSSTTAT
jgi:virginiamycin B lyase